MGQVRITETAIRDGHQSLLATRMRTEDMLPALERMDAIGYGSIECWGGAPFDTAMRFLLEDPWERLREVKARLKNTPTQMLLRGQTAVGYRHYADDVVLEFCERAVENGMDIFRIFDALNDTRNLETAFEGVKRAGGHVQGTLCYTTSPVHTVRELWGARRPAGRDGRGLALHQGHGGAAEPGDGGAARDPHQGRPSRRPAAAPLPRHLRLLGDGVSAGGSGRRGHDRHGHQPARGWDLTAGHGNARGSAGRGREQR